MRATTAEVVVEEVAITEAAAQSVEELRRERARLQEEGISERKSFILNLKQIAAEAGIVALKTFMENFKADPRSLNFSATEIHSINSGINPEDPEYSQKASIISNVMPFIFC